MKQGEIRQYREILALSECLCTRPIDDALRMELERRIRILEELRPADPPQAAVPIHMLKGWRDNDDVNALITRMEKSHRDYGILCEDMEELEKQAGSLKRKVRGSSQEELRELYRARMRQERVVSAADGDLRKMLEQRTALREGVAEARKKAAKEAGTEGVIEVASLVDSYRRAFQELVSLSVPYYRKKLEERVQAIFASLYQKDPDARIAFEGNSYLPRIRTADGGAPSEGEKLRLGISLLLAFRDIASEQPFLFLDAPFAELDDEGTDRLLTLLTDQDSQIIILTKNRFPPEPFQIVSRMKPATYEMVFDASLKVTSIRPMAVAGLLRGDAG
jgi:DNA repair exonuclease SbcCD ATPase subunit